MANTTMVVDVATATLPTEQLVSHRLIELYVGKDLPVSTITATYRPRDLLGPLVAVEGYPIIEVQSLVAGSAKLSFTNDDKYVWPASDWPGSVTLQYLGGLEAPVYDAIVRQTKVFANRKDLAPEISSFNLGGDLQMGRDARYRSALAPDVKAMLGPYRVIGF